MSAPLTAQNYSANPYINSNSNFLKISNISLKYKP